MCCLHVCHPLLLLLLPLLFHLHLLLLLTILLLLLHLLLLLPQDCASIVITCLTNACLLTTATAAGLPVVRPGRCQAHPHTQPVSHV